MAYSYAVSQHADPFSRIWLILNNETHVQFFLLYMFIQQVQQRLFFYYVWNCVSMK